jgi:protoporphyrinogen oxidase
MAENDKSGAIAVIAGAGPAGLTAALELSRRSNIQPVILELDSQVGGISKTINYRGNRMDLGGHRFFSKSDWVMRWWQDILPVADHRVDQDTLLRISYQNQSADFVPKPPRSGSPDAVMLIRERLSRIFYRRRFFDYPLKLNAATLQNMGLYECLRIGLSYGRSKVGRRIPENSLEDFFVNRFGHRLYQTFFKSYTEKVWGVSCTEISAEWGAQRIKGLSVTKAIKHALAVQFRAPGDTAQKKTETSLIERFLYPKFGPGQMWEAVARQVANLGGELHLRHRVVGIEREGVQITAAIVRDEFGAVRTIPCSYFISTMPVRELTAMLRPSDDRVRHIAERLPYRDFMTAGLLLKSMNLRGHGARENGMPPDHWIYIQEADVRVGRLQVFNNWSPFMVSDPSLIWLGLEYFCAEGDDLWSMRDTDFIEFAAKELESIGMIDRAQVLDGTAVRVPKAYPAYFGEYREFDKIKMYLNTFPNLFPIGRNGMHRYNNQDHSMLAARAAVDSILNEGVDKSKIWAINADLNYHESQEVA